MNISAPDIQRQFNRIVRAGWLPWFQTAAQKSNTSTAHFLAFGSRETNLLNIRGDKRGGVWHGFGVLQVDIETDPVYCRHWTPETIEHGITRGGDIYLSKVNDTLACTGRHCQVRTKFFTGKSAQPDDLRRIATAAYNCGRWAHYHFSRAENLDSTTTGQDYSRDVYDRAVYFAALLEGREIKEDSSGKLRIAQIPGRPAHEANALHQEIVFQGKYARDSHKELAGIFYAERLKLPLALSQEEPETLEETTYERNFLDTAPAVNPSVFPPNTAAGDPAPSYSVALAPKAEDDERDETHQADEKSSAAAFDVPQPNQVTSSVAVKTDEATVIASRSEPQGDAPDAAPRSFLNVEDWKPLVLGWLKRIWGMFGFSSFSQFASLSVFGVKFGGEFWWVYIAGGVVLFLFLLALALVGSAVCAFLWWTNRRELKEAHALVAESKSDPKSYNIGLEIKKKYCRPLFQILLSKLVTLPPKQGITG